MARTLYLMRHGTTVFNERQKIQGWCDSRLAAFGRAQCERMGDYFMHMAQRRDVLLKPLNW